MKQNIFLVGYMGSGKTTIGRVLATYFGCAFFDLDHEIEKQEKKAIADIFHAYGEVYFRKIEAGVLRTLISKHDFFVLATGGGTPCFYENMPLMNASGLTIYLEWPVENLIHQLKHDRKHRPLLKDIKSNEWEHFVTQQLHERERYYSQAKNSWNLTQQGVNQWIQQLQGI